MEFLGITWQGWATVVITIGMFVLALATKIKTHALFMGGTVILVALGILNQQELVGCFGNSSIIIVGALFIVVTGLEKSGVMHWLVEHLLKTPKSINHGIVSIMLSSAGLSSFMSNTSVTMLLLNIVRIWCRNMGISPSKLLIPMSYAAGTGGALTLIGSPSTLIIANLYGAETGDSLGFFAPTIPALICMLTCILMVMVLSRLLPNNKLLDEEEVADGDVRTLMTVPPDSPLVARTIQETGLKTFGGAHLVELRHFDDATFSPVPDDEPILGGDKLYFEGGLTKLCEDKIAFGKRTIYAMLILLGMVGLNILNVMPLLTACLLAAFALVIMHCCTAEEAYQGISWKILLIFIGSLALGKSLEVTGVATAIADRLSSISGSSPLAIMLLVCFIATFLTEFISNVAASALLFPVMADIVEPLELPLLPFTIALIIAVTCSFATPIGSPTHMLIYSPGGYRFIDFIKIGLPMNFIILAVNVLSVYFIFF